jgi:hypothetical protein
MPYQFEGSNYRKFSHLHNTELLAEIRKQIKETFPEFKFKINKRHYNSFNFRIMAGPIQILTEKAFAERGKWSRNVNPYWIHDLHHDEGMFTFSGRMMISTLSKLIESFNFDDSDIQSDYFHTNFYYHIEVGEWDKEYLTTK